MRVPLEGEEKKKRKNLRHVLAQRERKKGTIPP